MVPAGLHEELLREMHGGRFSGHFAWKKMYCTLRKRYWWRGMCGDVERFCKTSFECVSRKGSGRAVRPPLMTIPVGGPFHRMGVDVLQLPVTESGNKYVLITSRNGWRRSLFLTNPPTPLLNFWLRRSSVDMALLNSFYQIAAQTF